jgi:glycosyltransferase A (GT-A) superfamily protein (DUF2064 family)
VIENSARRVGAVAKILVGPDERHAAGLRALVDPSWTVLAQSRDGLMGGIVDAFEAAFARNAELVVVSDADSPLSLYEHLEACIKVGIANDVALGPTIDGGYYLVSARRAVKASLPRLFLGAAYESSTICAATAREATELDLTVGFGPSGFDVDTRDDLSTLARLISRIPARELPHTRLALAQIEDMFSTAAS